MIATGASTTHHDAWLSLPWLANGRLAPAERDKVETHVQTCSACQEELALQRLMCTALAEPDRVTYAPGPSFRKLLDRIDGTKPDAVSAREASSHTAPDTPPRSIRGRPGNLSRWRPPGLAWAASFILAVGLVGSMTTLYRSSHAVYVTHTDAVPVASHVLHIAFDRSLTIGEAAEALRTSGARIVEGPDSMGIFGVAPELANASAGPIVSRRELDLLATRLRADPRVRWVEPIGSATQ